MKPENAQIKEKRAKLARGITAKVENKRLHLVHNNRPFRQFRLSHEPDWMRGALYLKNEAFYVWDNRRFRKRPGKTDCADHVLKTIAALINQAALGTDVGKEETITNSS